MLDTATPHKVSAPAHRLDWIRVITVGFVLVMLLALSFVLGRATMSSAGHETMNHEPAVVQPAAPPSRIAPAVQPGATPTRIAPALCVVGRPC